MGVVHLARRADGHRVALKVMRPHIVGDEEARQRLAQEVSDAWPGIEKTPGVCGGAACIVRTRIPVWVLENYRRLVAGWVGEATRVRVIPYSYTLDPAARAGLESLLARAYGNAVVAIDEPVGWGDDEWLSTTADAAGGASEVRLALFGLTATPEEDAHGAFLDELRGGARRGAA